MSAPIDDTELIEEARDRAASYGEAYSAKLLRWLADRIEALGAENRRLLRVIERDRTATANWIGNVEAILNSREWLREGRGAYAWDDERYREEFRSVGDELRAAMEKARRETHATDLADSPTTRAEVELARSEATA